MRILLHHINRQAHIPLVVAFALTLVGCDSSLEQPGELGDGTFEYVCVRPSDAQCDGGGEVVANEALRNVAVLSTFGMTYYEIGASHVVLSSTPDRVTVAAHDITNPSDTLRLVTPLKTGYTSIVAIVQNGNGTEDFVHIIAHEPKGIVVSKADAGGVFTGSIGSGSVSASVASLIKLRAAPTNASGAVLAGALDCLWTSSDPSIAEITSDPMDNVVEVKLKQAGTVTFDVTLGALSQSVELVVEAP